MNFKIILEDIGRRFNRDWIFRGLDYSFVDGKIYAVLGANGSGKSTLFHVLNGSLSSSTGKIKYFIDEKQIETDEVYKYLSIAAPYLELIEDFTLTEAIDFHSKFKPFIEGINKAGVITLLGMQDTQNKLIKYFSSGMKQRLKLALAFCSATPILMLDEPTSNLDAQGVEWYLSLIQEYAKNRLTIICSNQEHEYSFCDERIFITEYKVKR